MKKWLILVLLISILYGIEDASATHTSSIAKPCTVHTSGQMLPVLYEGEPRRNPDGSFYPGDAFYYLIKFSASPTCVGLRIHSIESHDGLDVNHHNMTSWETAGIKPGSDQVIVEKKVNPLEIMQVQSHTDLSWQPKYVQTTHYYSNNDKQYLFSILDGTYISEQQKRRLDNLSRHDGYTTNSTGRWDFVEIQNSQDARRELCSDQIINNPNSIKNRNILLYRDESCQIKDRYVDQNSQDNFNRIIKNQCSIVKLYSGCIFGKVSINDGTLESKCLYSELEKLDIPRKDFPDSDKCVSLVQKIQQEITGLKRTCNKNHNNVIMCKTVPVHRTVTMAPKIIIPEVNLILAKESLYDSDGYTAQNLDDTYYLWDPITVTHIPELEWKNHRQNTIHFEVKKSHNLQIEKHFDCTRNTCNSILKHPGISDHTWNIGNGDGYTVYNATDESDLGMAHFEYHITAYNGDTILDSDKNTIHAQIVTYDPVYSEYPYPVLSDDKRTAYENRAAVALHYFGSRGGSLDDTDELHELRRSKINDYTFIGIGFDPWLPVKFNDTLQWSAAYDEGILPESQIRHSSNVTGGKQDHIAACNIKKNQTVMFVRAGYCKIFFDYFILDTVSGAGAPKYENVTLFNTLISDHFAGRSKTYLSHYEYRFPESIFHTNLKIVSLGADNKTNPIPLYVKVYPDTGNNTYLISQYISDKIVHDSRDMGFARIISQDVYPTEYHASGTGMLDVKLRRITSKFETYQNNENQNLTGLDIASLALSYMDNSHTARLAVPLDVGLGALSPLFIEIKMDQNNKTYHHRYLDFSANNEILINTAQDNSLDTSRYDGILVIRPQLSFGQISKLYLNQTLADIACDTGCTLSTPSNRPVQITAQNQWGGAAHATVPAFVSEQTPVASWQISNLLPIMLFIMVIVPVYWIYQIIQAR